MQYMLWNVCLTTCVMFMYVLQVFVDWSGDNQSNVYMYHAVYTNSSKHGNIVDSII